MIDAQSIIDLARTLERKMGDVENKDIEGWTLEDCEGIKDAFENLGTGASILYIACMTEDEMAELEREGRDDG